MNNSNIQYIVDDALCTGCGACAGICPSKAIKMKENSSGFLYAKINDKLCLNCKKCIYICPSSSQKILYKDWEDPFRGKILAAYIGHSCDEGIRKESQSGGMVTSLLCYLYDKKLIDGAIVNDFNKETLRPKAIYKDSKQGIIQSAGSYYAQSSVLQTILENQNKNTAAVVLGCQAFGLHLIRQRYKEINLPQYTIGLFCAGQYSGKLIEELVQCANIDKTHVEGFRYRDKSINGWPGEVVIKTKDRDYVVDNRLRHLYKPVFESYRCLQCFDESNVFSDVAVGDPWGINKLDNIKGNSVCLVRTNKGLELMKGAIKDGYIKVEEITPESIIMGQRIDIHIKPKFYFINKMCKQYKVRFAYREDQFSIDTPFISKAMMRQLKKRFIYSRKLYLSSSKGSILLINKMKKNVELNRIYVSVMRVPIKILSKLKRRLLALSLKP